MPLDTMRLISHDRLYRLGVTDLEHRQQLVERMVDGFVVVVRELPNGKLLAVAFLPFVRVSDVLAVRI